MTKITIPNVKNIRCQNRMKSYEKGKNKLVLDYQECWEKYFPHLFQKKPKENQKKPKNTHFGFGFFLLVFLRLNPPS